MTKMTPEEFLQIANIEEKNEKKGSLTIYLGYIAGVGKTYQMLEDAQTLVKTKDVVVGVVETHKREDTENMLANLEIVPRKKIKYATRDFYEMNLEEILERNPTCVLIDELAHTNMKGCKHTKRYQDVEEILNHGIDVLTTINIQHIESVNDIVYQITGVEVRETVPDTIFDIANKIKIIDITVEEHQNRMTEGKVYISKRAKLASTNFFREGNLHALRELTLRYTAKHVDKDVLNYQKTHGIKKNWPIGSKLMVCVSASPYSEDLIRMTHRLSVDLKGEWFALHITDPKSTNTNFNNDRLHENFKLIESLDGEIVETVGNVGSEIIKFAKERNITLAVLGYSKRTKMDIFLHGSIVDNIVHHIQPTQLLLVEGNTDKAIKTGKLKIEERKFNVRKTILTILATVIVGFFAIALKKAINLELLLMLFVIPIFFSGMLGGTYNSITSAVLSFLIFDFFIMSPVFTFKLDIVRFYPILIIYALLVAFSSLYSNIIYRKNEWFRQKEILFNFVYEFSKELLKFSNLDSIIKYIGDKIAEKFGANVVIYLEKTSKSSEIIYSHNKSVKIEISLTDALKWSSFNEKKSGQGTDTFIEIDWAVFPLFTKNNKIGSIAIHTNQEMNLKGKKAIFLMNKVSPIISTAIFPYYHDEK